MFQAYSCGTVMSLSLAKLAQELSGFDNANLVHWSVMPEGVGEGTSVPSGLIAEDNLTVSEQSIDCLFMVPTEAAFGFCDTPLRCACPPGGVKQIESPTTRLVQPLFIVGLKEASFPKLSCCVLRMEWQVSPCLTRYVLQVLGRHLQWSASISTMCAAKLLTGLHRSLGSNSPYTDRSESVRCLSKTHCF